MKKNNLPTNPIKRCVVQEHVHFHKYPWKAVSGARLNSFKERMENGKELELL